jgi:hypothetical protein
VYIRPSDNLTLNYSTFFGTDKPDSTRLWRIYHNLYAIFQFTEKIGLTAGFDIGTEQVSKGSSEKNIWFTPAGVLRFTPDKKWAFALRVEYFDDKNGVIISTGTPNGFKTFGASINIDRSIGEHLLWRTEFRTFRSKDAIFVKEGIQEKYNSAITTSLGLTF